MSPLGESNFAYPSNRINTPYKTNSCIVVRLGIKWAHSHRGGKRLALISKTTRLPEDVIKEIKAQADKDQRSWNNMLVIILERWKKDQKNQVELQG